MTAIIADASADASRPWYLATTPLETRPWLVKMRWVTVALELVLLILVWLAPELDLPLDHIVWLIAADAIAGAAIAWSLARGTMWPIGSVVALLLQLVLVTALLELTGGPSNPFVVVYVLQIVLAVLTLGRSAAAATAVAAAVSYGVLIYRHVHELVATHHRLSDFPTHLFTIWIASTVAIEVIAYFVGRASSALLQRETALEAMRERAARSERLVSLTTLAAGAAHELSTPLATIALTARELERGLEAHGAERQWTEDARLIRHEVDRCRAILDQMSGRAGGVTVDEPEAIDIRALLEDVRTSLAPERTSQLVVDVAGAMPTIVVPRAGLRQTVLSLVVNAFDAGSRQESPVVVRISAMESAFRISVHDQGPGLTPETMRRAGEPFFTTKAAGRGLGLGLFLARIFAERLGGSLRLESDRGTTAILELPCHVSKVQPT